MKRILTTMCALTLLLAASVPALAAEPEQSAQLLPHIRGGVYGGRQPQDQESLPAVPGR